MALFCGNQISAWSGLPVGHDDDRVTARGWALLLALLVLAASACSSNDPERTLVADDPNRQQAADDHDRLLGLWERGDQLPPSSEFRLYEGPLHCEMEDALILNMRWPVGRNGEGAGASFVRDPDGVMAEYTDEPFAPDTQLPDDAVATGYESDAEAELWLASDLSAAYLVDSGTVEAWPALESWVCA
jgi:hypothetical protein